MRKYSRPTLPALPLGKGKIERPIISMPTDNIKNIMF
jgi:hypothetical protein